MPEQKPKPLYKIGVIADTHGRFPEGVGGIFSGVDEIWHLGDVCEESILDELRALTPNVITVLGNNDFTLNYPLTRNLERNGEKFHLIHIPPKVWPPDANWVLFGHTHRPCDERERGARLFNPGSAGRANKGAPPSVGLLISENGSPFRAEIILL